MKEKEEVKLKKCKAGLGLKIVGGRNIAGEAPGQTEHVGIFIKEVIPNSIAAKSGRLHQGDQILQANGENLRGVSNERAVAILKAQTATDSISLLISRDAKSQSDYRRLSTSLGLERKSNAPTIPEPMATSTPVVRDSVQSEDPDTRPSSSVSEFTHISTTDFSTSHDEDLSEPHHGGRDSPDYHRPTQLRHHHGRKAATSGDSQVALSDVEVSMPTGPMVPSTGRPLSASSDHPPPLPLSSPPGEDDVPEDASLLPPLFKKVESARKMSDTTITPLKKNAGSPHLSKIIINKKRGLGIAVAGGVNKPDGPHIYIESLMDGMDAATDGQLQVGDRIISINEEMFTDVTREDAKTLLNKFKIRNVKSYDITFERVGEFSISPQISLPQPPRTDSSSVFSSSTPPAKVPGVYYDIPSSEETSRRVIEPKKPTPLHHKEPAPRTDSMHNRLSMKPNSKVKLSKLEWALNYMGYTVTSEQSQLMRSSLDIDDHGKVVFLDFVKFARDIFAFRLEETNIEANLVYALTQKEDINMPLYPRDIDSYQPEMVERVSPLLLPSEPQVPKKDFEAMRKQLHRRGEELDQKKRLQMSSDGETFDQVRKNGISPPGVASELYSDDTNENELRRQLAIIECQRKKEEAKAKRYEVTTEKLLSFVENCYEVLVKSPEADKILYYPQGRGESVIRGNQATGNPRPPQYLSRHAKVTSTTLAKEAKETIVAVRKILDASVLPYGWEEAYTVDGQKYYKNHEHQKTSWEHPLSSVNSNVSSQASSPRSTPQPTYP